MFLDVSVDRKPFGRIVVQLFDDVPTGSQRFADLAVGKQGVGYRLSKFDALREVNSLWNISLCMPTVLTHDL